LTGQYSIMISFPVVHSRNPPRFSHSKILKGCRHCDIREEHRSNHPSRKLSAKIGRLYCLNKAISIKCLWIVSGVQQSDAMSQWLQLIGQDGMSSVVNTKYYLQWKIKDGDLIKARDSNERIFRESNGNLASHTMKMKENPKF
jgi:hypothetical protein